MYIKKANRQIQVIKIVFIFTDRKYEFTNLLKPIIMNNIDRTFWTSEKGCIYYINQHETVWSGYPIIRTKVNLLIANEQSINDAEIEQKKNNKTSHNETKKERIQLFVKKCYKLNRKLTLLAKDTNNKVLLAEVDKSETAMLENRLNDIFVICSIIISRGREYLPQTGTYGGTLQEIEALEADYAEVKLLPEQVAEVGNTHKSTGQNIKQLIAEAHTILDHLDDAFEGMIDDQAFIDGWFEVRKIKGRHHGKKKDDGTDTTTTTSPTGA